MIGLAHTLLLLMVSIPLIGQSIIKTNRCFKQPDTIDGSKIYTVVSHNPEYKGGNEQLLKDISKNIKHPDYKDGIDERITLTFVIDTLGKLRNLCFVKPEDGRYDTLSDSLAIKIDNWIPGKLNNKKVAVRVMLPIIIEWK
jgi:hypothetical protein